MDASVPERLLDFAFAALDHAIGSVVPHGGPLIPFALVETGEGRSLARFPGDLEQGQAAARDLIASTGEAVFGAVAWDGYLTGEGPRADAVFVEASMRDEPESVILAQRYAVAGTFRKRHTAVGNPVLVAREQTILRRLGGA